MSERTPTKAAIVAETGTSKSSSHGCKDTSPTHILCDWISTVSLSDVPQDILTRAKYVLLDGIACALTGAALPASEIATRAISLMEAGGTGTCSVIGHPDTKLSPTSAALINSTYIQGFELDDWHKDAPLHSNAILIPALLAAAQLKAASPASAQRVTGADFLLGLITGYEVGPRVGNALYGRHILSEGWHSGAVFGPSAAAAAVSKLFDLQPEAVEDALGIACNQACGLMSVQFESDVKRMAHGFAARNGLLGVILAKEGYVGIKRVYEREYGGFLKQFSKGNNRPEPGYLVDEIHKQLGEKWQLEGVVLKPYASMAGTHATVDCIRALQAEHPELLTKDNLSKVSKITIKLEPPMFDHGGWQAERPLTATGAQMSNMFVCATQLVENAVMAAQFSPSGLESDARWNLVSRTKCECVKEYSDGATEVEIAFEDGKIVKKYTTSQRGVDPLLSNDEIRDKFRMLAEAVIEPERMEKIEKSVLDIENLKDISALVELLTPPTRNPLA